MHHRHIVETVDRTFQDLRDSTKLFGGLTVVFGGDFQQTLPIIPKGSRAQIVGGCLQRSPMWRSITVLHLHQNMCLNTAVEAEANFAQWQLDVGQGKHTDEHGNISLPDLFRCRENTIDSLIDAIYPGINTLTHPATYFAERAILSCLNKEVDHINLAVLERFPGPTQTFHSADYIPTSDQSGENDPLLNYPTEYLHKIDCSGLPLHHQKKR
jgi:PIF1-like helicase